MSHTAARLPHLEYLTIWNDDMLNVTPVNVIYSNPQLKHLKIRWNIDLNILRVIGEHLDKLESLDLEIERCTKTHTTDDVVQFKNVKKLRIGFFCLSKIPYIPMSFDRLEELTFFTPDDYFDDTQGLIKFISNIPRIKKFNYTSSSLSWFNPLFVKQILRILPSLEAFNLSAVSFGIEEAIDLLEQSTQLKSFQFKLLGDYSTLQKRLGENGWRSTVDKIGIVKAER